MARLTDTLGGRVLVGVLAVHFLLLPPLFLGLLRIVEDGEGRVFINEVRSYANFIGDELERDGAKMGPAERQDVLDGIVLSGHAVYAELEGEAKTVSRAFENEGLVYRGDDFAIHSGGAPQGGGQQRQGIDHAGQVQAGTAELCDWRIGLVPAHGG